MLLVHLRKVYSILEKSSLDLILLYRSPTSKAPHYSKIP